MNARAWLFTVVGLFGVWAAPASAEGPYLGLYGGGTLLSDANNTYKDVLLLVPGVGSSDTFKTTYDRGYNASGVFGYDYGNNFRVELEGSYRKNDVDKIKIVGVDFNADGDVTSLAAMLNLFYDFNLNMGLVPYIGGGAGGAQVSMNSVKLDGSRVVDDSTWVLAYQFGAGVAFPVSRQVTLSLDYRYFKTSDPEFKDVDGDRFTGEYASQNVMLGFRYKF